LKILKGTGIVRSKRIGQAIYYRLDRKNVVTGLRQIADAIDGCFAPEEQ
jgi:hypothetical protein